jgi:hypothetical protein
MGPGSAQEQWLRSDLAANTDNCTLAYWHHPRFSSSSTHGNTPGTAPLYQALYDHGAELVLVGHDHTYERFAPQAPNAQADPAFGIREFVVGTGGRSHYGFDSPEPNSEIRNGTTFGVLKLTLNPSGYSWQFLPVAGGSFSDSGSGTCHDTPGGAAADNTIAQATLVMALPTQAAMLTRIPARIVRGKTRNRSFDRRERIDQPFSRWAQRRAWMPGRARRH